MTTKNIFLDNSLVTYQDRCNMLKQKGKVFWLTGLSGSGKSTIARGAEKKLFSKGYLVYRLDGDNLRQGLNNNLGFSEMDREENVRRASETAALFKDAGIIVLATFISPMQRMREAARIIIGKEYFHDIFIKADVITCMSRDPKGLYVKAQKGEILDFTGLSSAYEEPGNPDLIIDTTKCSVEMSVDQMTKFVEEKIKI